jgi:hypothetical protein
MTKRVRTLMTKEEMQTALRLQGNEVTALRMYAGAMRDGSAPDLVIPDVLDGTDGSGCEGAYIERWTLYRADSASGGVIVVEQFPVGSDVALGWDVRLACEMNIREGDHWRLSAMSKVHAAQTRAYAAQ